MSATTVLLQTSLKYQLIAAGIVTRVLIVAHIRGPACSYVHTLPNSIRKTAAEKYHPEYMVVLFSCWFSDSLLG